MHQLMVKTGGFQPRYHQVHGGSGSRKPERPCIGHDAGVQALGNIIVYQSVVTSCYYKVVYHFGRTAFAWQAYTIAEGCQFWLLVVVNQYFLCGASRQKGRHVFGAHQRVEVEAKHKLRRFQQFQSLRAPRIEIDYRIGSRHPIEKRCPVGWRNYGYPMPQLYQKMVQP
jgi:hypothetical protein